MDEKEGNSYEFDDLLNQQVGAFGRGQKLLCFLLVLSNGCLAFHSLGPVFIAATPEHWCSVDRSVFPNCTAAEIKALTIPHETTGEETTFSSCSVYSHNISTFNRDSLCDPNTASGIQDNSSETRTEEKCDSWEYDTTYYSKTIVNEVGCIFSVLLLSLANIEMLNGQSCFMCLLFFSACVFHVFPPQERWFLILSKGASLATHGESGRR